MTSEKIEKLDRLWLHPEAKKELSAMTVAPSLGTVRKLYEKYYPRADQSLGRR